MVPALHYLLWLWLDWGAATEAQGELEQVIHATESVAAFLPCNLGPAPASNCVNLTWNGPSGETLLNLDVMCHHSGASLDMAWGLRMHNTSQQEGIWFTCSWRDLSEGTSVLRNGSKHFPHSTNQTIFFPCDAQIPSNWMRGSLVWIQQDDSRDSQTVLSLTVWRSDLYWLWVRPHDIALVLPSVTSADAGSYSCHWKNHSHHIRLEVTEKSVAWLQFGDQHWIIWVGALGYLSICLSSIFCFRRIQKAFRARRQQKKLRGLARRNFIKVKKKKAFASNGRLLSLPNRDDREQVDVFSYENVLPDMGSTANQQPLQKRNTQTSNTTTEEDNDQYECPDSETELKSDDGSNYENTQEEMKLSSVGNVVLSDGVSYENSKEVKSDSHTWGSADPWYANNVQRNPLVRDPLSEDGENYENVDEETPVSSGAARLIAGLRLRLAREPQMDRQDGSSETSTGSQSYEEMNGTLSPTASKTLHLQPNTSNEEDADSYENMESPSCLSPRKECNTEPRGEGATFGFLRQSLPIPFAGDARGGMLCSD